MHCIIRIRLCNKDNSLNKNRFNIRTFISMSLFDFVIIFDGIYKRNTRKCIFAITQLMTAVNVQLRISL